MNSDPWKGSSIPNYPKVLILGESHYDGDNFGEKVSFPTSGVVKSYFESRHSWSLFFDRIVESFGYDKDNARMFFEKVFFGNYIDVLCGVGDKNAEYYADLYRDRYNTEWFDYINQNDIDIVVCFSKLAYNHFPSLNNSSSYESIGKENVGENNGKTNYVEYCTYSPNIEHNHCSTKLKKPLKLYGICHPSARGGFNPDQIYKFTSKQDDLSQLCYRPGENNQLQVPEPLLVKADTLCKMFLNLRNDAVNTKELTDSFYQYIRAFCLMMAARCKRYSDLDYRNLLNYITKPSLSNISEEDYKTAIDDSKLNLYEDYLKSDHSIILTLKEYDLYYQSSSSSFEAFLRLLSMLAILFAEIDSKNQPVVNNYIPQLLKSIRDLSSNWEETAKKSPVQQQDNFSPPKHNKTYLKTREVDFQFFVRIIVPLMAAIVCCVYALVASQYIFYGIAIIPIIIFFMGVKANERRCPICRAWNSLFVSGQELIKQDKVKVRRPLGSAYFRTSGKATFGIRQTFVSADENTYKAKIKCRICGYETKTVRTVIDDKIR